MNCANSRLVIESLDLARRMIILADEAEAGDVDDGCVLLCGILRDCAYRIRHQAESEKRAMQVMHPWGSRPVGEGVGAAR